MVSSFFDFLPGARAGGLTRRIKIFSLGLSLQKAPKERRAYPSTIMSARGAGRRVSYAFGGKVQDTLTTKVVLVPGTFCSFLLALARILYWCSALLIVRVVDDHLLHLALRGRTSYCRSLRV